MPVWTDYIIEIPMMNTVGGLLDRAEALCVEGDFEGALELLGSVPDPPPYRALYLEGRCLWRLNRFSEAEAAFRRSIDAAVAAGDEELIARAHMTMGAILCEQSRSLDSIDYLRKCVTLLEGSDGRVLGNAYNWLGQSYVNLDLYDLAAKAYARGLEVAVAIGAREIESVVRSNTGLLQMQIGDCDAAVESFRHALSINREIDHQFGIADNLSNIGIALYTDGRPREAVPYLRRGMEAQESVGAMYKLALVGCYLADSLDPGTGREEALSLVSRGLELAGDDCYNYARCEVLTLAFELYMKLGMLTEAESMLESLGEFLEEREVGLASHQKLARMRARMARERGDQDGVFEHMERALKVGERLSSRRNAVLGELMSVQRRNMQLEMDARTARMQKYESLGILTAGIAHDFNNSLHAILGSIEGISGDSGTMRSVERIRRAVEEATQLCRQMLAFGGHASMNRELVDVNEAVREVVPFIAPMEEDVRIGWEPAEGLPRVCLDPLQLKNWVISLVVNSMEAMEGRGTVTVSTGHLPGSTGSGAGSVVVSVEDDGPGISGEHMPRVFDPFFSTKRAGRGMGLSVIKGSVEAIGGTIEAVSRPGEGTVMTLVLPATSRTAGPDEGETGPEAPGGGLDVALVDDEEMVLEVTGSMLETLGHRVSAYRSGPSLLDDLRRGFEPDCILLDMTMPEMMGSQVFVGLRETGCTAPVVLMSGFSSRESMSHFRDEMPGAFLQKPFDRGELELALGKVLRETDAPAVD